MTDFTTLSNPSVAVGGIPSGATVTALRDNPIAIAEGAAGAPSIALRAVAMAAGTGTVSTGVSEFTGIAGIDLLMVHSLQNVDQLDSRTSTTVARYRLSNDGGSTFTGYTTLQTLVLTTGASIGAARQVAFDQISISGYDTIEFSQTLSGTTVTSRSFLFAFHSVTGGP
jgi:hypothetical protein